MLKLSEFWWKTLEWIRPIRNLMIIIKTLSEHDKHKIMVYILYYD